MLDLTLNRTAMLEARDLHIARSVMGAWETGARWAAYLTAEDAGEGSHAWWLYWLLVAEVLDD